MNNLNLKNILLFSLTAALFSMNTVSTMTPSRRICYPKKVHAAFKPQLPITLKNIFVYYFDGTFNAWGTQRVINNLIQIINDERQPQYIKEECLAVLENAFLKLSPATNEIRKSLESVIDIARAKLAAR